MKEETLIWYEGSFAHCSFMSFLVCRHCSSSDWSNRTLAWNYWISAQSWVLIILDIYWNVTSGLVSIPRVYGVRAVQSGDNGSHLGLTLIRISDKQGFVITMFTLTIALRCLREEFLVWWHFLSLLSLVTEPYCWPLIGQWSLDVSPWSPVSEVIITDAGTIYIPWPLRRHFQ